MLKNGFFTYHIVDQSPWPLYSSCGAFMIFLYSILTINNLAYSSIMWMMILFFFSSSLYGWMRDVCTEGFLEGNHTKLVQTGLKMGMMLFIISEILFFFSFFWSLFYYSVTPSVEIFSWPPTGLESVNPMGVPLLGSLILISSGFSITWSHHSTILNKKSSSMNSLMITILLGLAFSILQLLEYMECSFTMSDSVFGSIFFLSTGFHGFHVLVGTFMLIICFLRFFFNHFSHIHHVGFEASIWYWHFVDVVWIFLYVCMYWWGSM